MTTTETAVEFERIPAAKHAALGVVNNLWQSLKASKTTLAQIMEANAGTADAKVVFTGDPRIVLGDKTLQIKNRVTRDLFDAALGMVTDGLLAYLSDLLDEEIQGCEQTLAALKSPPPKVE